MNVLIFGGNGFIGSHVVDRLLIGGHSVRVFDQSNEAYRQPVPNVDYHLASFGDLSAVETALMDMDVVCHFISTTVPSTSNADPALDVQDNLVTTLRMLEKMREKGQQRIVYLSSGGTVYGSPEALPVPESHALNPICSYGVVKVAIEKYLFMYQQIYGFLPLVLRPSNPYGKRQSHQGVQGLVGTLLKKLVAGESLDVWGDGNVVRDYIYVEDLANLCVSAIEANATGVFNAGSGVGHSVNEIINKAKYIFGFDPVVQYKKGRVFDVPEIVLNIDRARDRFGWIPETSLQEGMEISLSWLKKQ